MKFVQRKTGEPFRRLGPRLTSDDIVARASDVQAQTCPTCKGEGFLNTERLCPQCFGSGAMLVPRAEKKTTIKVPRAAHGRGLLGWGLFYLAIAAVLAYWILK